MGTSGPIRSLPCHTNADLASAYSFWEETNMNTTADGQEANTAEGVIGSIGGNKIRELMMDSCGQL